MRYCTSRKPFNGCGCQMLSSYQIPKLLLPFAVSAALLAPPMLAAVQASPFSIPHGWAAAATKSIAEPVRRGGRGGGGFRGGGAGSTVAVSRAVAASIAAGLLVVVSIAASLVGAFIAGLLVVVFIVVSWPGRSSAAVTMAASTMVIDVATGMVAGGPMVSVRAGG